jgi:hypothetical protein
VSFSVHEKRNILASSIRSALASRVLSDSERHARRLPRLSTEYYRGQSWIHWSMTLEDRATGWLDDLHHARLRECLVHALGRHRLVCPIYCLMPDHAHFVWLGWSEQSDQKCATKLLREAWNNELRRSGCALQVQAHDHVLRESERERGVFGAVASYVLENPIRAGLVADWRNYHFSGAIAPGYPTIDPRQPDFWEKFWRIFDRLLEGDRPAGD